MKKLRLALVSLLLLGACGGSGASSPSLTITQPSGAETIFAELRDFYVIGSYPEGITQPGNIKIELFRGAYTIGVPIRTIQSQVDPSTCVTPESSLDLTYPNGVSYGITMVPDIVKEPNGILNPNNKVVVTNTYYAGLILGGATKTFDTTYEDSDGNPLEDLTAGTYTIKVSGLSCDTNQMSTTKQITFGLTHASLGRFSPTSSLNKLQMFTTKYGYRIYRDNFPGYFAWGSNLYEIKSRWMPNNSIEVVNDLDGTTIDDIVTAVNDILVYNIKPTSATNTVETAALVKYDLTESSSTAWHYYDVGEPTLNYVDENGSSVSVDGNFADFADADRHVLIRAEVQTNDGSAVENLYNVADTTPIAVDFDLSDGLTMTTADEFSLYGVVCAIPSTVTDGSHSHEYTIDNRIAQIKYTISLGGTPVTTATKDINLGRIYDAANPTSISYSSFEYKHVFSDPMATGAYTIDAVALDSNGAEVDDTAESLSLVVN